MTSTYRAELPIDGLRVKDIPHVLNVLRDVGTADVDYESRTITATFTVSGDDIADLWDLHEKVTTANFALAAYYPNAAPRWAPISRPALIVTTV